MVHFAPDVVRRLAGRFPAITLLLGGVLLWLAPMGLMINLKNLDNYVTDRYYSAFKIAATTASGFAVACNLVGILMVVRSAQLTVRKLMKPRPSQSTRPSRAVEDGE